MINIDSFQELVESMDIIAENKFKTASQIYYCLVKSTTSGSKCVIDFNNKEYIVPYFAGTPIPNKTYALFLPQNNMNQAFVIGEGGSGGGGGSGIAIQPDPPTGDELVWIDTDDPGTEHIIPEVKDNEVSQYDTWSSAKIRDFVYPVGSIYISVNATSPADIFGGTWERITGKFLLGATDGGAAGGNSNASIAPGNTGGEATHKLTVNEMPSHTHAIYGGNNNDPPDWFGGSGNQYGIMQRKGTAYDYLQYVGGNGVHNNMPPYLAVYIWKRTA